MKTSLFLLHALVWAPAAFAQTSNIDPAHKFSWGENIGWMNWQAAGNPVGSQGALINPNILSGYVWCENVGYLSLGDGSPANGSAYANLNGTDFGVNLLGDDRLAGLAWGENIGWINLDDPTHYVGTSCPADFNCDGFLDFFDYDDYVTTYEGGTPPACRTSADFNGDGFVDFFDYDDFVAMFEAGC